MPHQRRPVLSTRIVHALIDALSDVMAGPYEEGRSRREIKALEDANNWARQMREWREAVRLKRTKK